MDLRRKVAKLLLEEENGRKKFLYLLKSVDFASLTISQYATVQKLC